MKRNSTNICRDRYFTPFHFKNVRKMPGIAGVSIHFSSCFDVFFGCHWTNVFFSAGLGPRDALGATVCQDPSGRLPRLRRLGVGVARLSELARCLKPREDRILRRRFAVRRQCGICWDGEVAWSARNVWNCVNWWMNCRCILRGWGGGDKIGRNWTGDCL